MPAKSLWSKLKSLWTDKPLLTQFWAGEFDSDARFYNFVEESDAFYSVENEEGDGPLPLSEFAGSQGERWYDHDFLEYGRVSNDPDPKAAFSNSWSQFWADEFMERAHSAGVTPTHMIMACDCRSANRPEERLFDNPRSATGIGFNLVYLGEIEHEDYP